MDSTTTARSHAVGKGPKYLIRDRDSKYATHFSTVAVSSGIKELRILYGTPQTNGICERFMGSLRRECLDHILLHEGRNLERVVKEYTAHFNKDRPHQGIDQRIPDHYGLPKSKPTSGHVTSKAILGGHITVIRSQHI
jgi:putative transposase